MAEEQALTEILTLVDDIQGTVALDLRGLDGKWGETLRDIGDKLTEIRALCGDEHAANLLGQR